jgi:hypothetical protein
MTTPTPTRRWFHVTPARFFIGLLAVQVFLFLSDQLKWFPFNGHKGWTVLIAIGVVGLAVVVMVVWGLVWLCLGRRFQFGVRSLLLFLVAVSIPLGWFAWEMQKARRQREAVEAILDAGASVLYDYRSDENGAVFDEHLFPFGIGREETSTPPWLRELFGDDFFCDVTVIWSIGGRVTDSTLEHLKGVNNVRTLHVPLNPITDNGLEHIRGLKTLTTLTLFGAQITDAGLEHLNGLNNLQTLSLNDTQVTDAGLENVKGLTRLQSLGLSSTEVTDAGLEHLKGLTHLKTLCLSSTEVTDAGLEHLEGLTSLEWLELIDTQVTDEGVEGLHEALPKCRIDAGPTKRQANHHP